jgi:hypothetical protein
MLVGGAPHELAARIEPGGGNEWGDDADRHRSEYEAAIGFIRSMAAVSWVDGMTTIEIDCSVDGCANPVRSRGWCKAHYDRWRRTGSSQGQGRVLSATARFWMKVDRAEVDGCWLWTAATWDGYGKFFADGRKHPAHRFSYELAVGPVPDGLELDHLCRNRACVNPSHLEPVSKLENWARGASPGAVAARTSMCMRGHPRTPEHARLSGNRWLCLTCRRIRDDVGPNPHYSDTPALIPEHAPEPTRTTTAVV